MTAVGERLVQDYLQWLRSHVKVREDGDWTEITTPYLDRHNDFLQIYLKRQGEDLLLTDGGWTLEDLAMGGCDLGSPRRAALLKSTLQGLGVDLVDGALQVVAGPRTAAARKHMLLQAMMAVNDMFYLARPHVESMFHEDVAAWLKENDIPAAARLKVTGMSKLDYHFDFIIPGTRKRPETLMEVIASPEVQRAKLLAFAWVDTQPVREEGARALAMLNDQEKPVRKPVLDTLRTYGVLPVPWSERETILPELAA